MLQNQNLYACILLCGSMSLMAITWDIVDLILTTREELFPSILFECGTTVSAIILSLGTVYSHKTETTIWGDVLHNRNLYAYILIMRKYVTNDITRDIGDSTREELLYFLPSSLVWHLGTVHSPCRFYL